jgi:hypothetical protein
VRELSRKQYVTAQSLEKIEDGKLPPSTCEPELSIFLQPHTLLWFADPNTTCPQRDWTTSWPFRCPVSATEIVDINEPTRVEMRTMMRLNVACEEFFGRFI